MQRIVFFLFWAAVNVSAAAEPIECYKTKVANGRQIFVEPKILRKAALEYSNKRISDSKDLTPEAPDSDLKRCIGTLPIEKKHTPNSYNYYGEMTSKASFASMVKLPCGQNGLFQFFSIGSAYFVRNCESGQGVGYVYFWGFQNEELPCIDDSYPGMYAAAGKPTLEQMRSVYRGRLKPTSRKEIALAAAMSAILIAETYRDHLVLLENYMLINFLGPNPPDPVRIIGGRCVPNAPDCKAGWPQDGTHPIAWGGAEAYMMENSRWGKEEGATSVAGRDFESNLVASWSLGAGIVERASSASDCKRHDWDQYSGDEKSILQNLFNRIMTEQ